MQYRSMLCLMFGLIYKAITDADYGRFDSE